MPTVTNTDQIFICYLIIHLDLELEFHDQPNLYGTKYFIEEQYVPINFHSVLCHFLRDEAG